MEEKSKIKVFEKEIDDIVDSIIDYVEKLPELLNEKHIGDIKDKLVWVKDYFGINSNKEYLHSEEIPFLKRGNVILVKTGENFGMEFSGDHPAIVLRDCKKENDQVLILSLTSKKPKQYDPNREGIYIEFKLIPGLKGYQDKLDEKHPDNGKHWANILNIRNISKSRIIYPPKETNIDGEDLKVISATICSQIALRKTNFSRIKSVDTSNNRSV